MVGGRVIMVRNWVTVSSGLQLAGSRLWARLDFRPDPWIHPCFFRDCSNVLFFLVTYMCYAFF